MEIAQILENQQTKKKLEAKRQKRVRQKLMERKRKEVNLDHDHFKTGHMEKTKIISKKTFQKEVQKARKVPIEIQDNINVNTFLTQNSQYSNVLERTKQRITFDENQLTEGCKAISAYAQQSNIIIYLTMKNQVQGVRVIRVTRSKVRTHSFVLFKIFLRS